MRARREARAETPDRVASQRTLARLGIRRAGRRPERRARAEAALRERAAAGARLPVVRVPGRGARAAKAEQERAEQERAEQERAAKAARARAEAPAIAARRERIYRSRDAPTVARHHERRKRCRPDDGAERQHVHLFNTGLWTHTSTNVTSWGSVARVLGPNPSWIASGAGRHRLWAPDISFFGGSYHLYYSASTFGSNRSCIGHATRATSLAAALGDHGGASARTRRQRDDWNAIDPNVSHRRTTAIRGSSFGSFWGGIKIGAARRAARARTRRVRCTRSRRARAARSRRRSILRRCGYYYLFVSFDRCCKGADSTYNIRVGRSASMAGPYVDKAGTAIMTAAARCSWATAGWFGPGAQSVFRRRHARLQHLSRVRVPATATSNSTFRILTFDSSGWPVTTASSVTPASASARAQFRATRAII